MRKKTVKASSPKARVGQVRSGHNPGGLPEMIYIEERSRKGKYRYRCILRTAVQICAQDDCEYMTANKIETDFPVVEPMTREEFYDTVDDEPARDAECRKPEPEVEAVVG